MLKYEKTKSNKPIYISNIPIKDSYLVALQDTFTEGIQSLGFQAISQ